jgi:hypothetical protein
LVETSYEEWNTPKLVFKSATKAIFECTNNLDVIRESRGRHADPDLPSWVPNWSQPSTRSQVMDIFTPPLGVDFIDLDERFNYLEGHRKKLYASKDVLVNAKFLSNSVLGITTLFVDQLAEEATIGKIGAPIGDRKSTIQDWVEKSNIALDLRHGKNHYFTGEGLQEVFAAC